MENSREYIFRDETIDLKKYFIKILINWHWFLFSLFFSLTIAYLINRYTEPIYSVNSTIIVRDDEKSKGLTGAENIIEGLEMFSSKKNVNNEIDVLKSYSLTNRALKELKDFEVTYIMVGRRGIKESKLYTFSPFIVELDSTHKQLKNQPVNITILDSEKLRIRINNKSHVDTILNFGSWFTNDQMSFRIGLRYPESFDINIWLSNKFYFIINDINKLTNQYKNKLTITVNDKKGSVLKLVTNGYVAKQEADFLNKLGDVYIKSGLEEKNQTAINTIEFVDSQLKEVMDSLRSAEYSLQNFRMANKLLDLDQETQFIIQKIEQFQSEKTDLTVKYKYYNYLLDYLDTKDEFDDIVSPSVLGIEDPVLNNLILQLADLNKQRSMMRFSARQDNPSLALLNESIHNLKLVIIENARNNLGTLDISLKNIDDMISTVEAQIHNLPVTERQYINIERRFNLNNNIYIYLLQKRAEAGIAKASNIPDNKILDPAHVENAVKVSPRNSLNFMLALAIGLLLPFLVILIYDYFNNKIVDKSDIERNTNIPIIGAVGHNDIVTDIAVIENPKSSLAESFRSIRTNLQYLITDEKAKIISVSSALSSEGKTFIALNLASIIAMSDVKTLLLGMDLRKPRIHRIFNVSNNVGISNMLIGESSADEIIFPTNVKNLYICPSGPIPPNPAELLNSARLKEFIKEVSEKFTYIVMDTPPLAIVTDAQILNKISNINLFIIRQKFSNKGVLQFIQNLYEKKEFRNLCLVINDIRSSGYYGYAYRYGYGYGYGYHYDYSYRYSDYVSGKENNKSFFKKLFS
jgi:capsular exopolysaccharide synthesis family protein